MGRAEAAAFGDEKAQCYRDLLSFSQCKGHDLEHTFALPRRNHVAN
jgi:hypothetical protein